MSLRVQVFQHVPFEGLGFLESVFKEAGAHIHYTHFFENQTPLVCDAFDVLVVMGGPMGVYDEQQYPWLQEEKRALREALLAGKPVLGICLGAQLMAEVLGGRVTRNRYKEIGWWPVERVSNTPASWASELFPERFTTFHWHGDTFSIPPEATPLFQSEGCAHQGFVWGRCAVGLQFHPEITPENVDSWMENGDEELRSESPYVQNRELLRAGPEVFAANHVWMARLCRELIRLA